MSKTEIKFGTDGWRAIIGRDYTYENVRKVIQAWCDVFLLGGGTPKRVPPSDASLPPPPGNLVARSKSGQLELDHKPVVVLGYDRRFSSDLFAQEAACVLAANGISVLLSETFCPTPCVSWLTKETKALAGVVITASHNPFQWNGVKFKESYGGSASPEYCQKIEEQIVKNDAASKIPLLISFEEAQKKNLIEFFDPLSYVEHLRTLVNIQAIRKSNLKIAVDPIYGAGSGFIAEVLGQEVVEIRSDANPGFGGVNPEPIEKNLKALIKIVRTEKCDIGLATDGDADRIGAVDEKGNFIDSHKIFSLILRHLVLQKNKKGDVVTTVSTTQMVRRLCQKFDLPIHETPIGFKYICQKFVESENPLMGGEESGGLGICHHVYERDGILSGLLLLDIMAVYKKPISEIIADLQKEVGPLEFVREDLHVPQEKIAAIKEKLSKNPPQTLIGKKIAQNNFKDGFKFLMEDDSWLLIRPSGTEPLLRIYAEAPSFEIAHQYIEEAKKLIA